MGPRAALSQVLIAGAFVLLVAIGVGIAMGNHVLGQVAGREPVLPTAVPLATPSSGDRANSSAWKRISVMSVATDPGFPDPRFTPEPEVRAVPHRAPTPKPTPTPYSVEYLNGSTPTPPSAPPPQTPPASPEATEGTERAATFPRPTPRIPPPARTTLPPVPVPSLNP